MKGFTTIRTSGLTIATACMDCLVAGDAVSKALLLAKEGCTDSYAYQKTLRISSLSLLRKEVLLDGFLCCEFV